MADGENELGDLYDEVLNDGAIDVFYKSCQQFLWQGQDSSSVNNAGNAPVS